MRFIIGVSFLILVYTTSVMAAYGYYQRTTTKTQSSPTTGYETESYKTESYKTDSIPPKTDYYETESSESTTDFNTDYCRKGLCQRGRHIACGNSGGWGSASNCGTNPQLYPLTDEDKEFILDLHNKHRQEIASGSVPRYASAANMKEVTWNDELAHVASFNAKGCVFAHDDCRNTDDHPYSGQNLAIVGQSKGYKPFRDAYEDLHTKWFMEHEYCDMNNIRSYENKPIQPNKQIGHFTQMVSDNVDEVGCCVSMYEKRGDKPKDPLMKYVYIVCNYSYISISNRAIYVEGKPKCKKFSKKYKSLCCK